MTVLTAVLDNKILTMASIAVAGPVIVNPVINPSEVAPFKFRTEVSPPLPPPLPPEHLPMIAPSLTPSNSISDKEDGTVAEFHQNNWKEYVEEMKLKSVNFCHW